MFSPLRMLSLLAGPAVATCLLIIGGPASANPVSIQLELYGLPSPSPQIAALTIPGFDVGQTAFTLNGQSPNGSVSVSINTDARQGVVAKALAGQYAAPVSGGSLDAPAYWTAPYFSTGTGSIILTFSRAQSYFGLLWGSVDRGNAITFNNVVDNRT